MKKGWLYLFGAILLGTGGVLVYEHHKKSAETETEPGESENEPGTETPEGSTEYPETGLESEPITSEEYGAAAGFAGAGAPSGGAGTSYYPQDTVSPAPTTPLTTQPQTALPEGAEPPPPAAGTGSGAGTVGPSKNSNPQPPGIAPNVPVGPGGGGELAWETKDRKEIQRLTEEIKNLRGKNQPKNIATKEARRQELQNQLHATAAVTPSRKTTVARVTNRTRARR